MQSIILIVLVGILLYGIVIEWKRLALEVIIRTSSCIANRITLLFIKYEWFIPIIINNNNILHSEEELANNQVHKIPHSIADDLNDPILSINRGGVQSHTNFTITHVIVTLRNIARSITLSIPQCAIATYGRNCEKIRIVLHRSLHSGTVQEEKRYWPRCRFIRS